MVFSKLCFPTYQFSQGSISFPHPNPSKAAEGKIIFTMPDVPHCLKNLRTNIFKYVFSIIF